jgi:Fur family ferric uptake transcriptional regulator
MKDQASILLKESGLSITDSRKQILQLFLDNKGGALKHGDIEKALQQMDRVTIYRSLQIFSNKGVIHSIPSSDGTTKYALCQGACTEGHHHDNHVHFYCNHCEMTVCLDGVEVPTVKLPNGFKSQQMDMVLNGLCNQCSSQQIQ